LDNPPTGTTGYVCNQDSCQNYWSPSASSWARH
jgi:hypothetical protein